jgi:cysteinyl-tRNA synthetase
VVLAFAAAHYRQPMAFGPGPLGAAAGGVRRIREAGRGLVAGESPPDMAPLRDRFFDALADDFNTPQALAAMWDWIREANRRQTAVGAEHLREMLGVLGLDDLLAPVEMAPSHVIALASARLRARQARDFAEADRLRDEIAALGWVVRDSADGYELSPLAP